MNSGLTARLLAKYRPSCPIIMVTRNATAARFSHLYRGVYPFHYPGPKPDFDKVIWQEDVDKRLKWGVDNALALNILKKSDTVIAVQGWRGGLGHTNTYVFRTPRFLLIFMLTFFRAVFA